MRDEREDDLEHCPNCGEEMIPLFNPHPGNAVKNCGDCHSRFKYTHDEQWEEIESGVSFQSQMLDD